MHHEPASGTGLALQILAALKKTAARNHQSPVFRGFALSVVIFWHNSATLARTLQ
jgi:hypothetical protein